MIAIKKFICQCLALTALVAGTSTFANVSFQNLSAYQPMLGYYYYDTNPLPFTGSIIVPFSYSKFFTDSPIVAFGLTGAPPAYPYSECYYGDPSGQTACVCNNSTVSIVTDPYNSGVVDLVYDACLYEATQGSLSKAKGSLSKVINQKRQTVRLPISALKAQKL